MEEVPELGLLGYKWCCVRLRTNLVVYGILFLSWEDGIVSIVVLYKEQVRYFKHFESFDGRFYEKNRHLKMFCWSKVHNTRPL